MFRGIHADAKCRWLEVIDTNLSTLRGMPYTMDRLRLLHKYAEQIHGIGDKTVWDTLLYIENNLN